jgi:hypothetical protein
LDDEFVEEASVVELPDKFSATDQPDVFPASGRLHLLVHGAHVTLHQSNVSG